MPQDIPNYKAVPIRLPFLTFLFLFICALLISLEYLIRTLPNEHDRTGIPGDSNYIPVQKRRIHDSNSHATRLDTYISADVRQQRWDYLPSATQTSHAGAATPACDGMADVASFPMVTPAPQVTRGRYRARATKELVPKDFHIPEPRLSAGLYANTDLISTYITRVDGWYGDPHNPYLRTPLFPGQDTSGKCVYHYPGVVVTNNSSGCPAIINMSERVDQPWVYPPAFQPAERLTWNILVPSDGRCAGNWELWHPISPPLVDVATNEREVDEQLWRWVENMEVCTRAGGDERRTRPIGIPVISNMPKAVPVVIVYTGIFTAELQTPAITNPAGLSA